MSLPHLFPDAKIVHGRGGRDTFVVAGLGYTLARFKTAGEARVAARLLELTLRRLSSSVEWDGGNFQSFLVSWMSRAAVGGVTFMLPPANIT